MSKRTTILLDDPTREAAKELASLLNCTMSDAIREAIVQHRNRLVGVSSERRRARTEALRKLIELADGNDADAEIARLKAEDAHG